MIASRRRLSPTNVDAVSEIQFKLPAEANPSHVPAALRRFLVNPGECGGSDRAPAA